MLIDILIILGCGVMLWLGANQIVAGASALAARFGVSELVIGLTIVAFGTSAPELSVTLISALRGYANISISNVVGSNIINLGLVMGTVAVIGAIKISRSLVRRDGLILIMVTALLIIFLHNGRLSHGEGIVFVILFIAYNIFVIRSKQIDTEIIPQKKLELLDIPKLILGFIMISAAGYYLVESAVHIARVAGLSEWAIGQTIVAFGTSLPELATSLAASLKGRHELSAGNLVGSNIFNILGVLGISATVKAMTINPAALFELYLVLGFTVVAVMMMRTGRVVSRLEGAILIVLNLAIWAISLSGARL
jgi:cation:H+ antiporter